MTKIQSFRLMKLIEDEYVKLRVRDSEFAEYATTKLGFPVSRAQVTYSRTELIIQKYEQIDPVLERAFLLLQESLDCKQLDAITTSIIEQFLKENGK